MDKKISDCDSATVLSVTDLFPIVSSGINKKITAGVLFLNIPNIGNSGITKNVPYTQTAAAIDITKTVCLVSSGIYTIAAGSNGQEIKIISTGNCSLILDTKTAVFSAESALSLIYSTALSKWIVSGNVGVTIS